MRNLLALYPLALICAAQSDQLQPVPSEPNNILGDIRVGKSTHRSAFIGSTDQVFPHIAIGGGWETVIVIVNVGFTPVSFQQRFYAQDGKPMQVTFRSIPDNQVTTTAAAQGVLSPGGSFSIAMAGDAALKMGWASLQYDADAGRLGGYAAFRYRQSREAVPFEALVPLSRYDDYAFFMPFDNIEGFSTAIALVNPASNLANHVTITALDRSGTTLASAQITLEASAQTAFVLTDKMPSLAGRIGTLIVESDLNRLSAPRYPDECGRRWRFHLDPDHELGWVVPLIRSC